MTRPGRGCRGSGDKRTSCPPRKVRREFPDFKSIVQDYLARKWPGARRELDAFRRQSSLRAAVEQAALARGADSAGAKHSHQWKIPNRLLRLWADILLDAHSDVESCRTFAALFRLIDARRIKGIGELAVYDTAHRIGEHLAVEPEEVYLHRGTRDGAVALGFDGRRKTLRLEELPEAFQALKPYQAEDCLCVYKDVLGPCARNVHWHPKPSARRDV